MGRPKTVKAWLRCSALFEIDVLDPGDDGHAEIVGIRLAELGHIEPPVDVPDVAGFSEREFAEIDRLAAEAFATDVLRG